MSPRELEILQFLSNHAGTDKEIGDNFGIAAGTVKVHIQQILRKTKTNSRSEAIIWSWREGIILDSPRTGRRVVVMEPPPLPPTSAIVRELPEMGQPEFTRMGIKPYLDSAYSERTIFRRRRRKWTSTGFSARK